MKNCRDIESLLPLYLEGVLSDAEKRRVQEHLAGCGICQKEMAYLQKSGKLVAGLPGVEEPPWFQQKIMAQVRKEAEKKSLAQKWFYPLRIKIPIQIMATMVIAVLAVYIYRSGDEQVKQILPGVRPPAVEVQKEQPLHVPAPTHDMAKPAAPDRKALLREETKRAKEPVKDVKEGSRLAKSAEPETRPQAALEMDAKKAEGFVGKKDDVYPAVQAVPEPKSAKAGLADRENNAEDRLSAGMAQKKESYKMAAPAAPRSMTASVAGPQQASISLRVDDLSAAASDVEKILVGYAAIIKSRQVLDRSVILQAGVSGRHWKEFLSKLKALGQVEEKAVPQNIGERDIAIVIEMFLKE